MGDDVVVAHASALGLQCRKPAGAQARSHRSHRLGHASDIRSHDRGCSLTGGEGTVQDCGRLGGIQSHEGLDQHADRGPLLGPRAGPMEVIDQFAELGEPFTGISEPCRARHRGETGNGVQIPVPDAPSRAVGTPEGG
jgi:hypothetical protein